MGLAIDEKEEIEARNAKFAQIIKYIDAHPGCRAPDIRKGTGLSPGEAATYLYPGHKRFYRLEGLTDFQWVRLLMAGGIEGKVKDTLGIFVNESMFGDLCDYALERFGMSLIILRGKYLAQREEFGVCGSSEPCDDAIDQFEAFEDSMERRLRDQKNN